MTANEARESSFAVAQSLMKVIFANIDSAANEGRLWVDHDMNEDLHDLYDYVVIPELEKLGFSANPTSRTTSSSENGDKVIRYIRICWHPKP